MVGGNEPLYAQVHKRQMIAMQQQQQQHMNGSKNALSDGGDSWV
jgi:hypothetical protein